MKKLFRKITVSITTKNNSIITKDYCVVEDILQENKLKSEIIKKEKVYNELIEFFGINKEEVSKISINGSTILYIVL